MPTSDFFRPTFDVLAADGCLGNPQGQRSYAYLRIASIGQADHEQEVAQEQVRHIHEAAGQHNLCIPLKLIFADCHSGLDLEGRPSLTQLRHEYTSPERRSTTIVIEHVCRLSRVERHLTFLLTEMREKSIQPIFFQPIARQLDSGIEQIVFEWPKITRRKRQ